MKRLLIANRGEIAVRIIRAARSLGVETVALFSDADEGTLPVRLADQAVHLPGSSARDTYLNLEKVIQAGIVSGVDAVHPGYGFFAENADFARAVQKERWKFVGPSPDTITLMGDKGRAREHVAKAGVPIVPGTPPDMSLDGLRSAAKKIGYPVLIKAVAGGSGRGMRVCEQEKDFDSKVEEAAREAKAAFGNDKVILEKYLDRPRHIEVQIFGDSTGNVVHLGERECSLQRRHQKVVEESPAPNLHPELRRQICEAAVKAAKSVEYESAGTVECLVQGGAGKSDPFFFLEMNTRIQVEHPVTEAVTGRDLVELQLRLARGEKIALRQEEIEFRGHAIEFRVNAEEPRKQFLPTTGTIEYILRPNGPGVREDSWVEAGTTVSPYYDSLLSKLIVWGKDRAAALSRANTALHEMTIEGVPTTLGFHRWLLMQDAYRNGAVDIGWIDREYHGEVIDRSCVGPLVLPKQKGEERRSGDHRHKT